MVPCFAVQRSILLTGTIAGFLLAVPASAQQQPAPAAPATPRAAAPATPQALPPGSPLIGRPDNNPAAAKLAPIAPPPIPTVADKLPTAQLKLPQDSISRSMPAAFSIPVTLRVGDKGTVFVGSRLADKVMTSSKRTARPRSKCCSRALSSQWPRLSTRERSTSPSYLRSPRSTNREHAQQSG